MAEKKSKKIAPITLASPGAIQPLYKDTNGTTKMIVPRSPLY